MKDRRSFYRGNQTVRFTKGETIFYQDMVPRCLYSIKSGVIESYNINSNGESQFISFETVGDIIPKCWAFSKTDRTMFYHSAYTDCELYVISKASFQRELIHNAEFTNKMLNQVNSALLGSRLHIDALGKPKAHMKLLYAFRFLALLYGKDNNEGLVRIQIPLTQQVLANITGLTRETTSVELHKIKTQKIIFCRRKMYIVDIKELNSQIDDEYNPGITGGVVNRVVMAREG